MGFSTCVTPGGSFRWGIHKPAYQVRNLRAGERCDPLGRTTADQPVTNAVNFPADDPVVKAGEWVYEIPNPFPFRGATYIIRRSAERIANDISRIGLPPRPPLSLSGLMAGWPAAEADESALADLFSRLPEPLMLTLAVNGTDPEELVRLARGCADFCSDPRTGEPVGLRYDGETGRPVIRNHAVFEALANNPALPVRYREVMVLRPGVQGDSPIVGRISKPGTQVYEYLRANSYIPYGHYAANMAEDAVRYRAADLTSADLAAMRHLYYQRTFVRVAEMMGIGVDAHRDTLPADHLEALRKSIIQAIRSGAPPQFDRILWGWNFGFDFSASGYRLHASHQQIHQQYALIPGRFSACDGEAAASGSRPFAFGDLIADFIERFRERHGTCFFDAYIRATRNNTRVDGRSDRPSDLVVHGDGHTMLFVPKAQTAQWELQLMPMGPVGNVLEADTAVRASLDRGIRLAVSVLEKLGARMVTCIEASKPLGGGDTGQRLLYCFLPRLPYSPGSFTEAQLRWINGHYPEDFAAACRGRLSNVSH